jgi:membrane protease YdiL (CAAX protease family)
MRPFTSQVACAVVFAQIFAIYLLVAILAAPPTSTNWELADPILKILPRTMTLVLVPLLSSVVAAIWIHRVRPERRLYARAAFDVLVGALAALLATSTLRVTFGPTLPDFIPAEENAGPGFVLSMAAGYGEEVIFRMILLPVMYLFLMRKLPRPAATIISATVIGLVFALLHEAGPNPSSTDYELHGPLPRALGQLV